MITIEKYNPLPRLVSVWKQWHLQSELGVIAPMDLSVVVGWLKEHIWS